MRSERNGIVVTGPAWRARGRFAQAAALGLAVALAGGSAAAQPAPPLGPPPPEAPPAGAPAPGKTLSDTLTGLAKAEYEGGRVLYGDRDYANSIVKFQRAYDLSREPRLLWNIAVCEKNLRRYSKMLTTIRRYRKEAGPVLTDTERANADEIVKTVETFVSPLKLTASEAGADVFIDDEKIGTTPLTEPAFADVGTRRIRVSKPGFKDAIVSKQIGGGVEVSIYLALEKELHRGRLLVVAAPDELISLDGKAVGMARWEGVVESGGHQVRVTSQGMAAYQSEAVVKDNETRRIDVTLNPLPRDGTKTVLWVIGGTLLAGGAIVGGAFLFKPAVAPSVPSVQGNINPGTVQLSFRGRR
jgi:hypothetical protein